MLSRRFLAAALLLFPSSARAEEGEIRSGELWPDEKGVHINAHGGGVIREGGRYYWYGEHKIAGKAGNLAQVGVGMYSSENLVEWRNEGIVLPVSDDPASPIQKGCILERPKIVKNSAGKFVMWFHLERKGNGYEDAFVGIASADKVTGPYVMHGSGRLDAGVRPLNITEDQLRTGNLPHAKAFLRDFSGGQMSRDMTLFADDDGKIYHICASEDNATLHIRLLAGDAMSSSGKYIRVSPGASNEAPAVFKHGGKYFMFASGCTGWKPNAARLLTADSMLGEWKLAGNPVRGDETQRNTTFGGQSTFVLPLESQPGKFIFMGDLWRPENAIDGRYLWLPVTFENGMPILKWQAGWKM